MNWSNEEFEEYLRRIGASGTGGWARPGIQEPQKNFQGQDHNRPARPALDDPSHEQFYITVRILFSDKRRRDLEGALATFLDCIVACRRQLEVLAVDVCKRGDSPEGGGGGSDNT